MKTSHLADKLYQLRAQKRIQQKELAAAIGVDAPMYSRIEKGTRIPKFEQLEKLASILDLNSKNCKHLWLQTELQKLLIMSQARYSPMQWPSLMNH